VGGFSESIQAADVLHRGDDVNKLILLVEDNPSDEKLTLRAFQKSNIANEILVLRDGVEACDYLLGSGPAAGHAGKPLPAVVLLDLKLPRVDGLEVLRRVRTADRTRLLPVVVLTASREEEDVIRSYALGANAYVRKPVDFTEFARAVQTLGMFWLLLNEPPPVP
jgi:CheY-like chemotaxis protein